MPGAEQPRSEPVAPTQIARDAFWAAAELGAGLMELDRQECMELLAAKAVGRLAYVVDNGARILPFNYVVAGDSVILRTVHDGEIYHHALSSICAFEVDETTSSSSRVGAWLSLVGWNWRPKTTSLECFTGRCLSPGQAVTGTCSYGCGVTTYPDGGRSATVGE